MASHDPVPARAGGAPQIDLTALNAVQSLFDKGPKDPWGSSLAAQLVDFLIWHDRIRYPVALLADSDALQSGVVLPPLLRDLRRREPDAFSPSLILHSQPRQLRADLITPAVVELGKFAVANTDRVKAFLGLHASPWIKDQIRSRSHSGLHYVFDMEALLSVPETHRLARRIGAPNEAIPYLLDLILKYLIYAETAEGNYYLTHPIRSLQPFSYLGSTRTPIDNARKTFPFSLGPHLVDAALSRGQDWFTSAIHESRSYVRESGMIELTQPGSVGREALRELAMHLKLPAQIRGVQGVHRAAAAASAVTGVAGSLVANDTWPAVTGCCLTLATTFWSGKAGSLSNIRWLQWMLEWPLESETERGRR